MTKPELQKWYENYFDLFATEGWKQHVSEMKEGIEQLKKELEVAQDEVQIYRIQGKLHLAKAIVNKEEMHRKVYDDLQEQGEI